MITDTILRFLHVKPTYIFSVTSGILYLLNYFLFIGYVWAPMVEVNLFSSKSVQDSIENVIFKLCQEEVQSESITVDTINKSIREEIPLPDPCFALIFGKTFSTFGFFPWQIRVTEFL